ncbi:Translation proteins SH3-like protein [Glarea lozoyensis ATCC 20868]|uniref:Large ribosomal subunit protein uL2m n=1 Tax=Glarea lozoyensis (strain ATCC 20868 / MF5171) TaxID=1116229 RepID=S3DYY2_GLAL2|nr:Translation proteins SH3-like protein [Glarea lozoyensis ATCC 20868]EPE31563.1 Translation proteins SH3-like protein [Glarea lozoyensis ATCC 20868]
MLQPRLLLRRSQQTTPCKYLSIRQNVTRTYATITEPVNTDPTPMLAAAGFAPPAKAEKSSATFAMRTYKPRTPGVRHLKRPINDHLWKGRPFLPLTFSKKGHGKGGRNNSGRVTIRHRGGGHKRRIRTVDFTRMTPGKHTVERIEHDPGRSAHIALLNEEATGRKSYIVAAEGMRAGDVVESYRAGIPKDLLDSMGGVVDPGVLAAKTAWRGNCLPLHMIPIGTFIYCVGSAKERGAVFCRSAGTHAVVISKEDKGSQNRFVQVRLQSGEIRKVSRDACATIGTASNPHFQHRQLGKAGRKRWLNIRPTVRGLAMNAADHPHGGGRGKSKGNVNPVSPWGLPAKGGYKTRHKRNPNKWVVTARERNHGKRRVK